MTVYRGRRGQRISITERSLIPSLGNITILVMPTFLVENLQTDRGSKSSSAVGSGGSLAKSVWVMPTYAKSCQVGLFIGRFFRRQRLGEVNSTNQQTIASTIGGVLEGRGQCVRDV